MPAGITFRIIWKNADATTFFQKADANNISNGRMVLDNPSLNNNPSVPFYAAQVWNPGGIGGVYNNSDITLEYDASLGK
ncbi:MAG: hypothetical protein SGI83_01770 [Bacteroidota bacterium]|nr:hypothetical protein [Bacteroidota bacterium]